MRRSIHRLESKLGIRQTALTSVSGRAHDSARPEKSPPPVRFVRLLPEIPRRYAYGWTGVHQNPNYARGLDPTVLETPEVTLRSLPSYTLETRVGDSDSLSVTPRRVLVGPVGTTSVRSVMRWGGVRVPHPDKGRHESSTGPR